MVNGSPGTGLTADWAVLGKRPGQVMGYQVLDGSLPRDRAESYLWGASTGTPESRDPAAALPWRVFFGSTSTDATPVCATVETTWDGSRDGTGAPSYAWRLFLLDWPQAGAARLTWSALDEAVPRDEGPLPARAVPLPPSRPPGEQLAVRIDELGFAWAAGVAALLLDDRRVALVPQPGAALPDVTERVRALDAVCALLPYGCRAWLSAATWTGRAEHDLRLVFTAAARSGQTEVRLGAGLPPEPRGEVARAYLTELLRLHAKQHTTADLVQHLLASTDVLPRQNSAEALRVLREADLLDSVVEAVRQGRGNLNDVQRVLEQYAVDSLGAHRLAALVPYLARCATHSGATPDGLALTLLRRHWSRATPTLLAEDVLARGSTSDSIALARGHLQVMHAVETERPDAFDALLAALATAPHQSPEWTGTLVYMAERTTGRSLDSADAAVIASRQAGLSWLGTWLADRNRKRDPAPLVRLVTRSTTLPTGDLTGWLRFAAFVTGQAGVEPPSARDAAEFAGAHEDAWEVALGVAETTRRPEAVGLLFPRLLDVARSRGEAPARLLSALDRLAPCEDAGLAPDVAADVDLLRVLHAHALDGEGSSAGLPRARYLPDERSREAYASILGARLRGNPEARQPVVEALLGNEPDRGGWRLLDPLLRQVPSMVPHVCDGLERRLADDHARWLELGLPENLLARLCTRERLGWLRPVAEFRAAVSAEESTARLAQVIAAGAPNGVFAPRLLSTVADFIAAHRGWAAYELARELRALRQDLDLALYAALRGSEETLAVAQMVDQFHQTEVYQHHRLLGTPPPGAPSSAQGQQTPTVEAWMYAPMMPTGAGMGRHAQRTRLRSRLSRWPFHRPEWFRGLR
ncbi:hypothetical protein AB0D34_00555 [Streptomyces sp. NPDC048420]|uniref:hypothetical protein n=1 Tax=Streptomyces sp. NPDC048420 TaxID=3155755 RepID=UPI003425C05E